jgi:hypothetical protein
MEGPRAGMILFQALAVLAALGTKDPHSGACAEEGGLGCGGL